MNSRDDTVMLSDMAYSVLAEHYNKLVENGRVGVIIGNMPGTIPVLFASGHTIAEAWENSLVVLYFEGARIRTQYDRKDASGKFIDPPSLDCSMMMVVDDPSSDPAIHRSFPGGLEDLEEYRQEVVVGIKDHWIRDINNPDDHRWEYTYHERMRNYKVPKFGPISSSGIALMPVNEHFDQFEIMAQTIAKAPITRRAQMVSWKVWQDNNIGDPACWQSFWARMIHAEDGIDYLNTNIRFRSRDGYQAAFMNAWGFYGGDNMYPSVAVALAQRIDRIRGETVHLGRVVDQSDSYHIYGKDIADFSNRFLMSLVTRKELTDRTWNREYAKEFFEEALPKIKEKVAKYDASKG
jgi:thymidylate synthase